MDLGCGSSSPWYILMYAWSQRDVNRNPCNWNFYGLNKHSPDLEVFQQASACDFAAVDLLHVDVSGAEEPRDQDLQVV